MTAIGMSAIRWILAPVLLTLILTICAHPVRRELERRGVSHGIATGSVILVVFFLLAGFAYTLVIAFSQFVAMLPEYSAQLADVGASLTSWLAGLGIDQAQIQQVTSSFTPGRIVTFFSGVLGNVFSLTGALVIVFTMLILMSADAVYIPTILRQLGAVQPDLVVAMLGYAHDVRRYMVVTTVLGIVQGALSTIALILLQVPAALLWGLLVFLCSFIPNVGYFFALVPPAFFGLLVGGWTTMIEVIVIYGIINAVVQSVIQPRVVGNAVALSQTLTFFSVLFWAAIIGPIGAIVAIPLTLLARTILIDAHPPAHWWRPAVGATAQTREILKAFDVTAKQDRKDKRALKHTTARPRRTAT
ncbi:AI-2E family transporter [Cryobacterium roopkundense]|uniref:Putative PurR-regulated permease PerM n=1 Tax=Cryobacterium roopkundense TaxID=1001240 RepID=A0A7W8ZV05_9MICO|nr:AI-2E family transporter [Cryobacterium roopkundense]MBB5640744.1 putative PurR-regulated permease PerM [Cryobacterium roopkundense]